MAASMNILQSIRSFIRTADAGSLAAAARTLGVSPAAVGQNIARLEAHLGVRLLNRTTRTLRCTWPRCAISSATCSAPRLP